MRFPVLLISLILLAGLLCKQLIDTPPPSNPVRIGIDGLSHDHVYGLLDRYKERTDIQIVGIAESNKKRAQELSGRYGFDMSMVYDDLATMIEKTKSEVYPEVDDQATIILTYPYAQAIIQGSWNWPVDRKISLFTGKKGM